jgi:hypothetical protein
MAAPVATVRGTPAGIKLRDGFRTHITFSIDPTLELWEKNVTPPGIEGGDAIDQTTMHNIFRRTKAPRQLYEVSDSSMTCAYDPACYDAIRDMVNVPQTITCTFSDGSTFADYGWLRSFLPTEHVEGEQPEAEVVIIFSGEDHNNEWVEASPITVLVAGT